MNISKNSRNKSILSRGFVAILLLVIFLVLALVLPRIIIISTNRSFVTNTGFLDVKYYWVDNDTLVLSIVNKYSKRVELYRIICNNYDYLLNNSILESFNSINITLNNINISKICFAKLIYYVDKNQYVKTIIIEPYRNYDFLKRSSNSTLPRG